MTPMPHDSFWHHDFSNYSNTSPENNANWLERMFFATHIAGKLPAGRGQDDVLTWSKRPEFEYTIARRNFSHKEH